MALVEMISTIFGVGSGNGELVALYNDTVVWLGNHWVRVGIATALAFALATLFFGIRRFSVKLCNRHRPGTIGWWRVVGAAMAQTHGAFIILAATYAVANFADPPAPVVGGLSGLFTIAMVLQAAIWVRALIIGGVELYTTGAEDNHGTLSSAMTLIQILVSCAVFAVALIVVLDNLGVNITGLVAGLGVGGIAIGLAAQGIFADLFAALAIIFGRPFRVGDVIAFDSTTGTVEEIGLKSTRIRPPSGELHIIANKNLLDKEIQNISNRAHRRIKFALGVIYQTPLDIARDIPARLQRIVEAQGYVFAQSGFVKFGDSGLDFEVEFDSPSPAFADFYEARHKVGLAILHDFNAAGIEFAYPTQTTFTAAPDGTMIMPYAAGRSVRPEAG
ncbi:MAG: mechanosensitive ion channel family protein [Sphingomonas sp.]